MIARATWALVHALYAVRLGRGAHELEQVVGRLFDNDEGDCRIPFWARRTWMCPSCGTEWLRRADGMWNYAAVERYDAAGRLRTARWADPCFLPRGHTGPHRAAARNTVPSDDPREPTP